MSKDEAMQYMQYAAKKALEELEKQYAVHFIVKSGEPSVFHSKIGGVPYFPPDAEIPVDSYGNQLRFLMQINCSDIQGIDYFPKQGMIQFWIRADDCWGMCDRNNKGYRVIYYDNIFANSIDPPISEFDDLEKEFYPIKGEFAVAFLPTIEDAPKNSIQYQNTFCKYFNEISGENIESPYDLEFELDLPSDVLDEAIYKNDSSAGHKIGGSSHFCQYDPRETEEQQEKYNFQLLQLCSDFGRMDGQDITNIMWGDAGICHFFINKEKLKNCDFSDVLYYADCC